MMINCNSTMMSNDTCLIQPISNWTTIESDLNYSRLNCVRYNLRNIKIFKIISK